MMKRLSILFVLFQCLLTASAQPKNLYRPDGHIYLDSKDGGTWTMVKADSEKASAEQISTAGYQPTGWQPATVPGTVLNNLVANGVYPEPYYGLNNKLDKGVIPDLANKGRDFYTYWFRTEFEVPNSYKDRVVWLNVEGINYRAEVWVNGHLATVMAGMFRPAVIDITDWVKIGGQNALAIKVFPVDIPGTTRQKPWGAPGEFCNGGDGTIGENVTMLMSVGWDFTFDDGIRDRNTGIWRSVSIYATGGVTLRHPFVKSKLNSTYDRAEETVSVEVHNTMLRETRCEVEGEIVGTGITFSRPVTLFRGETSVVEFTPNDFKQLVIDNPRLWWPIHKGPQNLYDLKLHVKMKDVVSDSLTTRFGIREIVSDQNTPDKSRQFYVNGHKLFVYGTNWIPEAMLRSDEARTYAELRYTQQTGINLIRMWGGGIAESDYFFQLCDEMGFLVWQEFWMSGDSKHPVDGPLYLSNVEATVKRLRNHPSLAYYVSSNESTEMAGARALIHSLDPTRGYQMQSECDGVHDGSPYKQVNPMQNYENTASDRGSRIDGFNPEYGAPTLPIAETLHEIMDEKDLWPINKEVWDYHDGGGFHLMTTMYKELTDHYGASSNIDEYAKKGQLLGAINSKSIWETWSYNKLNYGDRYTSGLLFWYHNCPVWQVCGRMWDYTLEPTASLYHTQNALEPLHPQFDYLKNTVSVVNGRYEEARGLRLTVGVYDLNSRLVWSQEAKVDVASDGVANDVVKVNFPDNLTQVHFIKLRLFNAKGEEVGSNFYWRSNDKYEGRTTLTGPCSSGFESLADMPQAKVTSKVKSVGNQTAEVEIKNTGRTIAFFLQLQMKDADGKNLKPCFMTDNFFTLMPGEKKTVRIDAASAPKRADSMVVKGWNIPTKQVKVKL